ncbi:MAG: Anaerobic ribonucleoside-triphosphate reductase, partial [Microgenomates bacterium 39_6]
MARKAIKSKITKIKKRSGRVVAFSSSKIERAIKSAFKAAGKDDAEEVRRLTKEVISELEKRFNSSIIPEVEQVQDIVEQTLLKHSHEEVHNAYTLYRQLHHKLRSVSSLVDADELTEKYLNQGDWRVKENANMTYSLQGLNNHVASIISANFWLNKIYSREIRKAHRQGDLHIHDLSSLSAYCTGWDLKDFLIRGFGGVSGKVNSSPPKHFSSALGQIVNFMYTIQGEVAGAVALSNFDTYLAPFIRYDGLTYKQTKQAMQEFVFNMNVPTRVGFQCFSEDTEILTEEGWCFYDQVKKGMKIKTFNTEAGVIEDKRVNSVFKKSYQGTMYRLKNRVQDQLISPQHRVVRKKFNTDRWVLEPIEEVRKLKSDIIIPVAADNKSKDADISDEQIKLMAWVIGEGSLERPGKNYRSCYRVSIYQSKIKNKLHYQEIKNLLDHFNLEYSEYTQNGLGDPVQRIRLNAKSSRL